MISDVLPDDVIFNDVILNGFWVIPKITSANLCKPLHDISYSIFIYPIKSGKSGKKGKYYKKFEYLENEKGFLDGIKSFSKFLKGYHLVKK